MCLNWDDTNITSISTVPERDVGGNFDTRIPS